MEQVGAELERLREIDRNQVWLARSNGRMRLRLGEMFEKFVAQQGHRELGFSTAAAYSLERLSRPGRWMGEARTVARRVAGLPRIRRAFDRGEFGWSKLELLCRHATEDTEVKLLRVARVATVRELRLAFVAGPAEENDPDLEQVSLVRSVPAEEAWELEATLVMVEHVSGGSMPAESVEWLLAEGLATLVNEAAPEVSDISEGLARRAEESRTHMRELAAEHEEREAEFEPDLPLFERVEGQAPFDWDAPLPDDPYELDKRMRELCWALDAADLWLGKSLDRFFSGRQYERLGYVSDAQYCRERLGMSRASAWDRIALARATKKLDRLADAVHQGEVGFSAARLLARVVAPETEEAWVERAKVRTYKHLREEVQLVEVDIRHQGNGADRSPPDQARLDRWFDWQRSVLTGEMFKKAADTGEPVQISGCAPEPEAGKEGGKEHEHKGHVDVTLRVPREIATFWQELEGAFRRSGIEGSFLGWLCKSYVTTWLPHLGKSDKWEHIYARDLYRCTSPVCFKRDCTAHHIVFRSHGGGDQHWNLTSPCGPDDHTDGIHTGRIRVTGKAPDGLTWYIGRKPILIVRGREKELV